MFSGIAHKMIMRYLSEYIKNLDTKLELLSGKLSLDNIMLREQSLEELLCLSEYGLKLVTCMVTHFEVNVPITKFRTEPIMVICNSALISIASEFAVKGTYKAATKPGPKESPKKAAEPETDSDELLEEKSTLENIAESINGRCGNLKVLFYTKDHCFLIKLKDAHFVQNKKDWILGNPKKNSECKFLVFARKISINKLVGTKSVKSGKKHILTGNGLYIYKLGDDSCSRNEIVIEDVNLQSEMTDLLDLVKVLSVFNKPRPQEEAKDKPTFTFTEKGTLKINKAETRVKIKKISVKLEHFGFTMSKLVVGLINLNHYSKMYVSFCDLAFSHSGNILLMLQNKAKAKEVTFEIIKKEQEISYCLIGESVQLHADLLKLAHSVSDVLALIKKFEEVPAPKPQSTGPNLEAKSTAQASTYAINLKQVIANIKLPCNSILNAVVKFKGNKPMPYFSAIFNCSLSLDHCKLLKVKHAKYTCREDIQKVSAKYADIQMNATIVRKVLEIAEACKRLIPTQKVQTSAVSELPANESIATGSTFKVDFKQLCIVYTFSLESGNTLSPYLVVSLNRTCADIDDSSLFATTSLSASLYNDPFGNALPLIETVTAKFASTNNSRSELTIPIARINLTPAAIKLLSNSASTILNATKLPTNLIAFRNLTRYEMKLEWTIKELNESCTTLLSTSEYTEVVLTDYDSTVLYIKGCSGEAVSCKAFLSLIHDSLMKLLLGAPAFTKTIGFSKNSLVCYFVMFNTPCIVLMEPYCCYQSISPAIDVSHSEYTLPYIPTTFNLSSFVKNSTITFSSKSIIQLGFGIVIDEVEYSFKISNLTDTTGVVNIKEHLSVLWSRKEDETVQVVEFSAPCNILNELSQKLEMVVVYSGKDKKVHNAKQGERIIIFAPPGEFPETTIQFVVKDVDEVYESNVYSLERLKGATKEGRYVELKSKGLKTGYIYVARDKENTDTGLCLKVFPAVVVNNLSSFPLNFFGKPVDPAVQQTVIVPTLKLTKFPIGLLDCETSQLELTSKHILVGIKGATKVAWLIVKQEETCGGLCKSIEINDFFVVQNCLGKNFTIVVNGQEVDLALPIEVCNTPSKPILLRTPEEGLELLRSDPNLPPIKLCIIDSVTGREYSCVLGVSDLFSLRFIDVFDASHSSCLNLELASKWDSFPLTVSFLQSDVTSVAKYGFINFSHKEICIEHQKDSNLGSDLILKPHETLYLTGTEIAAGKEGKITLNQDKMDRSRNVYIDNSSFEWGELICKTQRIGVGGVISFYEATEEHMKPKPSSVVSFSASVGEIEINIYPFASFIVPKSHLAIKINDLAYSVQKSEANSRLLKENTSTHYLKVESAEVNNTFTTSKYKKNLSFIKDNLEIICSDRETCQMRYTDYLSCKVPKMKIALDDTLVGFFTFFASELENPTPPCASKPAFAPKASKRFTVNNLHLYPFTVVLSNQISEGIYLPIDSAELLIKGFDHKTYSTSSIDEIVQDVLGTFKTIDWGNIAKVFTHSALFGNLSGAVGELANSFTNSITNSALVLPGILLAVPRILVKNTLNAGASIGKSLLSFTTKSNKKFSESEMCSKDTASYTPKTMQDKWVLYSIIINKIQNNIKAIKRNCPWFKFGSDELIITKTCLLIFRENTIKVVQYDKLPTISPEGYFSIPDGPPIKAKANVVKILLLLIKNYYYKSKITLQLNHILILQSYYLLETNARFSNVFLECVHQPFLVFVVHSTFSPVYPVVQIQQSAYKLSANLWSNAPVILS
eukprot:TRINITY_DN104_c0_g2_i1.p1 TRINITY_DN104_c0_g2~~TRINITY_DN104_c0_g2_i1.p1  ORF type:complete len:1755 (-),score=137.25 TRINITY_DN104_c0_g2_i1:18113-23377(-)